MSRTEELLKEEGFSKCISGCLVNLRCVTKISRDEVWLGKIQLPVSRQRKKEFRDDFLEFMGGV